MKAAVLVLAGACLVAAPRLALAQLPPVDVTVADARASGGLSLTIFTASTLGSTVTPSVLVGVEVHGLVERAPSPAALPRQLELTYAMERGGVTKAPIVPFEATAALSMLMLRDYNMLMVHFVGVPPGGADLLIKFVPPETLARFGGAKRYAEAVNSCLTKLGAMLREPETVKELLFGRG